VRQAEHWVLG